MQGPKRMAAAFFMLAALGPAEAQDYPVRPVKMIVPFPPGGSTDVVARFIAQGLSDKLGQGFVVENRAGAAGNVGADVVAKAVPDGYTLGLATSGPLANNKFLYKNMPFDSERAFTPVVLIGEIPLVIAVNPAVPVKNLKEFVDYSRANPGKVSVGNPGNGTVGHLAFELMKSVTRADMLGVPYKGDTPAMTDLLGGAIQGLAAPVTAFIPNIQAGKLKALAITSRIRLPALPDVATAIEQGIEVEAAVWFGMVGPAGLPRPVVEKINAEVNRIVNSPDGRAQLAKFAALVAGGPPERMADLMASDSARWKRIIESAKITLE